LGSSHGTTQFGLQTFNLYIEGKHSELQARGATDTAALLHLFQGYEATGDETFITWIKQHHDDMDDGTAIFTAEQLMQMAVHKYADLRKNGTWAQPSTDQEKIIALDAEVAKLHQVIKKPLIKNKDKEKGGKKKEATTKKKKPVCKEDEWKYVAPVTGAALTKNKGEQEYNWCPNHNDGKGMWVVHDPEECRNKGKTKGNWKKGSTKDKRSQKPKDTIQCGKHHH